MNRNYNSNFQSAFSHNKIPKITKALLTTITICFVIQLTLSRFVGIDVVRIFGFSPVGFLQGKIWQVVTYSFLHGGLFHFLVNSFMLYMFGPHLERAWGPKKFLIFYLLCAIGSVLFHTLIWSLGLGMPVLQGGLTPVIGASGALYGLLIGFGRLFKEIRVLAFFIVPMKMKNLVYVVIFIEMVSAVFFSDRGIAHVAHLGGMAMGYLLLKYYGDFLDGFIPWSFSKKKLTRQQVKEKLKVVINNDKKSKDDIYWN